VREYNSALKHGEVMALKVGDLAPDFELPAVEGERRLQVKLADSRGKKHVVVAFHPLDWTPT
jgi:peroxiredoxin